MWLQDSELTAKVGSMPAAYPADSTKAFCEVCSNAVIAKYCELKGITGSKSTQIRIKNFLHAH